MEGLSVRQVEALAKRAREGGDLDFQPESKSADVLRLERTLGEQLGCSVLLEGGQLHIDYGDQLDVLDGVLSRLGYTES